MALDKTVTLTIAEIECREGCRRGGILLQPGEHLALTIIVSDGPRLPAREPSGADDLRYGTRRAQKRREQDDALDAADMRARVKEGAHATERNTEKPYACISAGARWSDDGVMDHLCDGPIEIMVEIR